MKSSFEENFWQCCITSCDDLAMEKNRNDSEYQKLKTTRDNLYFEIAEKLGKDRPLMDDFDVAKNTVFSMDNKYIYQQGFQDCVLLMRWIGLL